MDTITGHITINPDHRNWADATVPAVRLANGKELEVPEVVRAGKRHLDEEFKLQWMALLLSGDLPQARHALHVLRILRRIGPAQTTGYCCLGVAGELLPAQRLIVTTMVKNTECRVEIFLPDNADQYEAEDFAAGGDAEDRVGMLPRELADPVGLTEDVQNFLAGLNDEGATFEEIAAIIDLYL